MAEKMLKMSDNNICEHKGMPCRAQTLPDAQLRIGCTKFKVRKLNKRMSYGRQYANGSKNDHYVAKRCPECVEKWPGGALF